MTANEDEEKLLRSVALQNAQSILLARQRAEEALRESEERYRSLTRATMSVVWTTDAEGRFVNAQPSWSEFTGQTWDELRDFGWANALHPDDRERVWKLWEATRVARTLYRSDGRLWHAASGSYRYFEARGVPILNADGSLREWVGTCVDVEERKRAEERLQESEAAARQSHRQLQTIYDITPVGMCLIDRDLRYVQINNCLAEMNGVPAADHIGKTVREMVPGLADTVEPAFLRIMQTGEPVFEIELKGQTKAQPGVDRTWLESWYPMRDASDRIVGVNVVAVEITERKRAEEQLRRNAETFSRLVDQSPFGIYTVDSEFRIAQVSAGAQPAFRNVRPLIGRDFGEAIRIIWSEPFASEVIDIFRRTLETGAPYLAPSLTEQRHDVEVVESYEWQIHRVPLPDGHYGIVCYFFDATRLRQAEEQLRRYTADLSESDRRKDEFLAMLAHELRNPLAPIRNAVQILRLRGGDATAVQSASEMMERQIGQMVRLVDDLLDVSRISRGKIELRKGRVELASVVTHAVEAARPLLESRDHELSVALPPQPIYLNGDPTRLAQVVGNLLNNACKFTGRGGRIWLTVEPPGSPPSQGGAGGVAVIRVRDTGIGIAADQLPRIFEMFTQVDTSLERSHGGLGIGLTLVRELVELHDGTLEAHSAGIGQGSEFVVRLPLPSGEWRVASDEKEKAGGDPLASRHSPLATKRRILVVDDNRDSAESLAMLFTLTGNETHTAYDGLQAVEAAATFRPEVVLLDIGLPKLNGYEAARKIREQPWGKGMVLVALTGWGQDEDRQKSRDAGFNDHLVKPVDHTALMKLLAQLPAVESSSLNKR